MVGAKIKKSWSSTNSTDGPWKDRRDSQMVFTKPSKPKKVFQFMKKPKHLHRLRRQNLSSPVQEGSDDRKTEEECRNDNTAWFHRKLTVRLPVLIYSRPFFLPKLETCPLLLKRCEVLSWKVNQSSWVLSCRWNQWLPIVGSSRKFLTKFGMRKPLQRSAIIMNRWNMIAATQTEHGRTWYGYQAGEGVRELGGLCKSSGRRSSRKPLDR